MKKDYGVIRGYVDPVEKLPGSIMSKSSTGGGGRGAYKGNIIGDVIFHGKKQFWRPGADYHYHHLLKAGESTLEVTLMKRAMDVSTRAGGVFDADKIREDYITFMTTKDSHNDTYCGTCHRMFFANLKVRLLLRAVCAVFVEDSGCSRVLIPKSVQITTGIMWTLRTLLLPRFLLLSYQKKRKRLRTKSQKW